MGLNRRELLGAALAGGTAAPLLAQDHPMASFDREMESFITSRGVPGGSLAVVRNGKLVYARGYGWADRERREPVKADSLFRIASISKPITAVAVLRLVEQGQLSLETRALDFLKPEGKVADARLARITVRQLLEHTGGWDRDRSFDPMFRPLVIAKETGTRAPARPDAVIRYMLGQPLDFDPGTRYAYSNFGYCLLGRIIEKAGGLGYEEYVRRHVLAPVGVTGMRVGRTLEAGRFPREVRYYTPDAKKARSVFPEQPGEVPWPYGGFHLEAMDAHGGWIASAVDLVRLTADLNVPEQSKLLKPATLRAMLQRPEPPVGRKDDGSPADFYYGLGWQVRPVGDQGRANYWHTGSLPGTWTLLVRRHDGLSWAALFNLRTEGEAPSMSAIDPALHRAAAEVKAWPETDLFPRFG